MAIINVSTDATVTGTKFDENSLFSVGAAHDSVTVAGGAKSIEVGSGIFTAISSERYSYTTEIGGEYTFTDKVGGPKLYDFEAAKATTGIKLDASGKAFGKLTTGSGNDAVKIGQGTIDLGAGDDSVELISNGGAWITLGAGKDTVIVNSTEYDGASYNVKDYDFAEGDLVEIKNNETISYGGNGEYVFKYYGDDTHQGHTTVKTALDDNDFYKVKVKNGDNVSVYATADTCRDSEFVAEKDAVSVDASKVTKTLLFISGKGNDTVSIDGAKLTYNISKQSGTDTLTGRTFGKDDVIVFADGGDLSKIDIDAAGNLGYFTAASVQGAFVADASVVTGVNFGEKDEKIAIGSNVADNVLAYDKDVVYYMGRAEDMQAGINVVSEKDAVTLDMKTNAANFRNIASVSTAAAGGAYTGWANGATSIFANTAEDKEAFIWGGSKDADFIDLSNADGANTVFWGSKDADGADAVKNFDADTDVLYLYETTEITDKLFKVDALNAFNVGGALSVSVKPGSLFGNDVFTMMCADGKEAVDVALGGLTAPNVVKASFDTDYIIADGNNDTTVKFVVFDEGDTECKTVNLNDATRFLGKVVSVDLTAVTNDVITIGRTDAKSEITGSDGKNAIWGGSKDDDTITLKSTDTDYVWFAAGDGKDTVAAGFDAEKDVVYLYNGATDAKTVADMVSFKEAGTAYITATKDTDILEIDNLTAAPIATLKIQGLVDGAVKDYNVAVGAEDNTTAGKNLCFDEKTQIYIGVKWDAGIQGINRVEFKDNLEGCKVISLQNNGDYYFKNITSLQADRVTSDLILIGKNDGDELRGGKGKTAMWGGSDGHQVMAGNIAGTDYFWFGCGDGHDLAESVSSDDMIVLWNVTDIDAVELTCSNKNAYLVINGGETLDMRGARFVDMEKIINDGLTFMLASGAQYTYDLENKKWVAKA